MPIFNGQKFIGEQNHIFSIYFFLIAFAILGCSFCLHFWISLCRVVTWSVTHCSNWCTELTTDRLSFRQMVGGPIATCYNRGLSDLVFWSGVRGRQSGATIMPRRICIPALYVDTVSVCHFMDLLFCICHSGSDKYSLQDQYSGIVIIHDTNL